MRKGLRMAALCALLMNGAAMAAEEEMESSPLEAAPATARDATGASAPAPGPAVAPAGDGTAGEGSAGGDFARMPPGADNLPEPVAPPISGESAVAVPEGNGTNMEAPAEDRVADPYASPGPDGALPAPGESAGSRI